MANTTIIRNGACQPQRVASVNPTGMPSTWLAANAVWTVPMTRPRISMGKRSVMIAKLTEPMTPPKRPVTMRATSRK